MTCADFRELAALYTLGALSPAEQAEADAHLAEASHEGCFEALRDASAGTEALAKSLVPTKPDERVWRGIESHIGAAARPRMAFRERVAWFAAAAAILLFAVSFVARNRLAEHDAMMATSWLTANSAKDVCLKDLSSTRGDVEKLHSAIAILQSPSSKVVALEGKGLNARALIDLAKHQGMIVSGALPAHAGRDFELWVVRGGAPVPAGVLVEEKGGTLLAAVDPALLSSDVVAVAISLEPLGGSPNGKPTEVVAFQNI
jgi:anti-sigma-K factor RskA